MRASHVLAVIVVCCGTAHADQARVTCLDLPPQASEGRRVMMSATAEGAALMKGHAVVLVRVRFEGEQCSDSDRDNPRVCLLRQLPPPHRSTDFTFTRAGQYTLTVVTANQESWPDKTLDVAPLPGCVDQTIGVEPSSLVDFTGNRPEVWLGLRLPLRPEIGAGVYFGRLGMSASSSLDVGRERTRNEWLTRAEVKWRGARGYLGGGVVYFPDKEPDRPQFRPLFVIGEELPPYRGRPTWLFVDIRLDNYRGVFARNLRVSVGARMDVTKGVPPF